MEFMDDELALIREALEALRGRPGVDAQELEALIDKIRYPATCPACGHLSHDGRACQAMTNPFGRTCDCAAGSHLYVEPVCGECGNPLSAEEADAGEAACAECQAAQIATDSTP